MNKTSASLRGSMPQIEGGASRFSSLKRRTNSQGTVCIDSESSFRHCTPSFRDMAAKANEGVMWEIAEGD